MFTSLAFFEPDLAEGWKWERKRRGLHVGSRLRHEGEAYFTAWSEDEPLVLTSPGWNPLAVVRLRWLRMRLHSSAVTVTVD